MQQNNSARAFEIVKTPTRKRTQFFYSSVIENKGGKILANSEEIAIRWKEYCSDLYNHKANTDHIILKTDIESEKTEEPAILREGVETAKKD